MPLDSSKADVPYRPRAGEPSTPISIADFPEDVFLLLLTDLAAWDVVSCQRVCKSWRTAFTKDEYIRLALQGYPRASEIRDLSPGALHFHHTTSTRTIDWQSTLLTVASRYHNLSKGTARNVAKYPMAPLEQLGDWFPVGQWDYHESQPVGRLYYDTIHLSRVSPKPYLFRPTLWSYDDGLLVYAPARCAGEQYFPETLALLDLSTGSKTPIPFSNRGKIIRNIRLKDRTLIVEWAEKDPFHNLNAMEQVNRHFANCFDVRRSDYRDDGQSWTVTWRSEWKMHFLGLPPNYHDRFFSTHTSTHYAVYFWQPNRSMYTGDEEMPIESLSVWDISTPSTYQPSSDPSGKYRPPAREGPYIVSRYSFTDMDFWGIRQHATVALMSLSLDSERLSLTVRENVGVAGQGYFDPAERLWCAKTTTFPFCGEGPRLYREWDGHLPPYRGHCSMESADVEESERWFLPVMDIVDRRAGVKLSLVETCFSGQSVDNKLVVRLKTGCAWDGADEDDVAAAAAASASSEWATLDDGLTEQICAMGRITGDERWVIGQNERMELVVVKF